MLTVFLSVALAALPCGSSGRHRDSSARAAFRREHPCPGGPDRGSASHCQGYVIDHVCPLACCGLDAPQNMQWQTKADAKAKDRWELDCSTCAPGNVRPGRP